METSKVYFTNLRTTPSSNLLDNPNDPIHDENNTLLASVAAINKVTLFFFINI